MKMKKLTEKVLWDLCFLAAEQGAVLRLTANGDDEDDLLDALKELIEDKKFGEE